MNAFYHTNYGRFMTSVLFFLFNHFLQSRAEIGEKIRWFFGGKENRKKIFRDFLTFIECNKDLKAPAVHLQLKHHSS